MSKRTRPKNAMIARRRLRRIRRHERAFQPWNFDPDYNVHVTNLYGYTRCPMARCRQPYRYSTQGRPWVVLCDDCGFRERLRPRVPVVFGPRGFSIVGGW